MKILILQVAVFSCFFLLLFGLTFNIGFFNELPAIMNANTTVTALLSIGLLASDIILPVPSSVLMLLNGKLFGIVNGTIISATGMVLSTVAGYGIGMVFKRRIGHFISYRSREESERIFRRWGFIALIISRPIPLLSESISIITGINRMRPSVMLLSTIAGSVPGAFVYAYYGSMSNNVSTQYFSFLLVLGIAALAWLFSTGFRRLHSNHYKLKL
jgi:uncharacterized membrane protein YdjX (TVP38/TMEM64 family)